MTNAAATFDREVPALVRTTTRSAVNEPDPPTLGYISIVTLLFLRRNLTRIAAVSIVSALMALGAAVLIFNKYSATAIVVVDPRAKKIIESGGVLANVGLDNSAIDSIALIAKSDGFLGELAARLGLSKDGTDRGAAVETLRSRLNVARRGATYVVDVTAKSPVAGEAAAIANAAAQLIVDDQTGLRSGASDQAARGIGSRLAEEKERVSRAEAAAAEFKAQLKVTDTGQGSTLLERRVYEINQQLVLANAKTGEARARLDQLRAAAAKAGGNLSPSIQSSVLNTLRVEYDRMSQQASHQATVLGPRHPEVASLNAQLVETRRQISAELARMKATVQTELLEAEQREAALTQQLKLAETASAELGPRIVKLVELDREAKVERALYEQLLTRQKELIDTRNLEPNDIRIVSSASPPLKTSPGLAVLATVSTLLGLLAGIGFAAKRDASCGAIRTIRQARRCAGAGVSCVVPIVDGEPRYSMAGERSLNVREWLGGLCSSIESDRDDSGVIIFVTSAERGEGRSTIAGNIAACLARRGDAVLLVEADRANAGNRKPQFGFCEVLSGDAISRNPFVRNRAGGYLLLPFGGSSPRLARRPDQLMSGRRLRTTLEAFRDEFDFIVIDGPPVLGSDHAAIFSAQADHTIFVVEWDKTSRSNVTEACDRVDGSLSTVILNKVNSERHRLFEPT